MIRKFAVINCKGGCGKTTLSTNLASFYAANGFPTALMDYDPQDSAMRWLGQRSEELATIHGVAAAHPTDANVTRTYQLRVPANTSRVVLDTPASMKKMEFINLLRGVTAIIIPVLPSTIDSHVTADFIETIQSIKRLHAPDVPMCIVANRVRKNTRSFKKLIEFLDEIEMPPVTSFRETENYVRAAECGYGIHEMKPRQTRIDRTQWQPLITWLEQLRTDSSCGGSGKDSRTTMVSS